MEDNNLTMADFMDEIEKSMVRIRKGDIKTAKVVSIEDAGLITNIGSHADAIVPWNEYSYEEVKMEDVQVGDTFDVLVLNTDDGDGNIIVSKKRAEAEVALENIEQLYKNHEHFVVKVKEVVKGGVIANLQGMRAFIPGSQITDVYVEDLNEFVGKEIEVEIIEFNPKNKKLVLSGKAIAKAKTQQAKKERFDSIIEGEKYTGTVTKLMPYGAFVNIGGVEGLVHNTDLSWTRIKHPSDVVKEGDKLNVTVLSIDKEKGKIALVGGKTYWINAKVHATQKTLTRITQEKTELKQQVEALDAEIKHLKTESEKLQTVLWRFDPVIIPESMKN